jgi:titin
MSVNDSGPGSLRQAILDANANPGPNDIRFEMPGPAPHTIPVGQQTHMGLPSITNRAGLVLDGTTQPDYQGAPVVVIDGTSATTEVTSGLVITAGSNTVRGLVISDFTGTGLVLGSNSNGNVVEGNYIGTNAIGGLPNPNLRGGILVNSSDNVIGGTTIGQTGYPARNVISGNGLNGIGLVNASNNRIQGNYIGTNAGGNGALGNSQTGIAIANGCHNNLIGTNGDGTDDVAERNVVSGNGFAGVGITDRTTGNNTVAGNYIGTNAGGTAALGNGHEGVFLGSGTQFNVIGTDGDGSPGDAAEGNLISGNQWDGIRILDGGTNFNVVAGNYVGTNAAGNAPLGNGFNGIWVNGGPQGNRIGADGNDQAALLERNVISGNNYSGVAIDRSSNANIVAGNYIGTTAAGVGHLGNRWWGVFLGNGSNFNRVGTTGNGGPGDTAERNVIADNGYDGVGINNASDNRVAGNYIGTTAAGDQALRNGANGVSLFMGSQRNVIGVEGASPREEARRNVISGNAANGIYIGDSGTAANVVAGNYIGTNAAGNQALGNGQNGVFINGARQNRIGVDVNHFARDLERNVIGANNGNAGVLIGNVGANANTVAGNYIGTDATGSVALGSASHVYGVGLFGGAANNLIGGTAAAARNVISGNIFGVGFVNSGTTGNRVQGNYIGTKADGVSRLGNLAHGVFFFGDASGNTIGGPVPEAGNVIAYSGGSGVVVASGIENAIRLNRVYANVGLGIDLGADGVTANHDCNQVDGPNHWQNYPVLALAQSGDTTRVTGTLNGMPNTTFTLDFYANAVADPSGYGQGERYLDSATVTTDDTCNVAFDVALAASSGAGEFISATATDPDGNTSEFSAVVTATSSGGGGGGSGGSSFQGSELRTAKNSHLSPSLNPVVLDEGRFTRLRQDGSLVGLNVSPPLPMIGHVATLAGAPDVALLGNHVPTLPDTFQVRTFGSHVNGFATKHLPDLGTELYLDYQLGDTGLTTGARPRS